MFRRIEPPKNVHVMCSHYLTCTWQTPAPKQACLSLKQPPVLHDSGMVEFNEREANLIQEGPENKLSEENDGEEKTDNFLKTPD